MKSKVFVVMPVFNRLNFTRRCLKTIGEQSYRNVEVVIIDDGSSDGTFTFIRHHYPEIHIIRGDGNWWWSKSVFEGIEYALGAADDKDYILLLNNDCFLATNHVDQLLKTASNYPKAVIGSFCIKTSQPEKVVEAGVRIYWPTGLVYSVAEATSTEPEYYQETRVVNELDALPGKGTLYPVKLIRKMGNINYKRLPHYIADYEFANRAKKFGYELLVDVNARIKHVWEATGYRSVSTETRLGGKEAVTMLFGRRSMNNVVDWFNFLLLACPKKYLRANFYMTFWRMMNTLMRIFPFVLIRRLNSKITYYTSVVQYTLEFGLYRLITFRVQFPSYSVKLWIYRQKIKIQQFTQLLWRKYKKYWEF